VGVAAALTVPWTYWVIQAAFDRDVMENAKSLARRVELRLLLNPNSEEAREALHTELASDATVQLALFVDLSHYPASINTVGWTRYQDSVTLPKWTPDEYRARALAGVTRAEDKAHYFITIPWVRANRALGFTYLELSRSELEVEFWKKDGSLVIRVIGLSAAAIAVLSLVGWLAFYAWRRVAHVQQRAELARQGLLAERGLTAAVLAHEIRNPLAALRFQLHSLRKNASEPTRVCGTADTIDAELSRIQQLVTDYLEHEKAQSMRVQPVDLADAARGLRTLMDELLNESRTELVVIEPPKPVIVTADPHALRQVLMNLVINAEQAMRGIQPQPRITLRIGGAEGYGVIDITDNGPGIPPEMRDRLFKPFQTSKADGHGIGLALVKRFVDNFGGSVGVESEQGRGTTFHLKLPLAEDSHADAVQGSESRFVGSASGSGVGAGVSTGIGEVAGAVNVGDAHAGTGSGPILSADELEPVRQSR
jgi:signal transduction histidine kinase